MTQKRLLTLAAVFLGLYALVLTLAPAARARSWSTDYYWGHWLAYGIWLVGFTLVHQHSQRRLPQRDPYLLPIIAMLSGWGLLTIWRLTTTFGLRQSIWLGIALTILALGLRLPSDLNFLRRYKYLWLTGGLLLTTLTLIFGTNPMGTGPRLWLGWGGIYLQPSEPLKLLLIIYLAAYLADRQIHLAAIQAATTLRSHASGLRDPRFAILIPTFIMTGLALLLLLVQRDLGTASIFIFIFSVMIYLATGWRLIPMASALLLVLSGLGGYALFDVVRLRVDAWINPWLDPSGRSFQIVQSLLAVANGGLLGRGPGLGSPSLVPVAHSDFVFAAIAEETGLIGTLGLLILIALLANRGFRVAFHAQDTFRRFLSAGLTTYLIGQSILIIGGNLRLLPLTGVTLPFVSYGGSSLVTSTIALLLLLHTSSSLPSPTFKPSRHAAPISHLTSLLFLGLLGAALVNGWWAAYRGPDLLTRTDNPRRAIADRYVRRGALLDRNGDTLVESTGQPGDIARQVHYPKLGPVLGYIHPAYGQSGLEDSLDLFLRGLQGTSPVEIWKHHLLYGQPPPGLDVRLTLDLRLQQLSDELLTGHAGALVLLNAHSGEILVMASHPGYNPNQLDEQWNNLLLDLDAPLLNRVTQGSYPAGDLASWQPLVSLTSVGQAPQLRLQTSGSPESASVVYPLQVALAAASLSNDGTIPAPYLTQAMRDSAEDWVLIPPLGEALVIMTPSQVTSSLQSLTSPDSRTWETSTVPTDETISWYVAGTQPNGEDTSLVLVLVLEENNLPLATEIGKAVLQEALEP